MNQKAYDYQAESQLKGIRVTYSIKHLPCSNPSCLTCMTGMGHGPYWYASYILEAQKKTVFIGRKFKPLDMSVVLKNLTKAKARKASAADSVSSGPRASVVEPPSFRPSHVKTAPKKSSTFSLKNAFPQLPVREDFDQDLRLLKGAASSSNLKYVYRKLIKKYHPDQFAGNSQMDRWLSEINSLYKELA